ncbi:MAG: porin family protein [Sulfurimonas sp.]|nr:porin family protein [Sulfurimonas sp.]
MKKVLGKIVVTALSLVALSQSANASGGAGFYAVPKAVVIMGDTIMHGAYELDGDTGVGIGVDLGYAIDSNFAVELALTHVEADVTEDDLHGHVVKGDAEYTTYGVMGVYSRTITGHLRGLVKLGYAWEYEKITDVHHPFKTTLSGIAYAAGLEYGISDNMEVVFEYEGAEVVSSRGDSLMLGLKYKF